MVAGWAGTRSWAFEPALVLRRRKVVMSAVARFSDGPDSRKVFGFGQCGTMTGKCLKPKKVPRHEE